MFVSTCHDIVSIPPILVKSAQFERYRYLTGHKTDSKMLGQITS